MMKPPWIEYPDYSMGCMGWRMGSGEDYIADWIKWYKGSTSQEREEYRNKYPPPARWKGFYRSFPS